MTGPELLQKVADVRNKLLPLASEANTLELPAAETALALALRAVEMTVNDLYRRFG